MYNVQTNIYVIQVTWTLDTVGKSPQQNVVQRIMITRVLPPSSVCDKQLDNMFSKFLISSCSSDCLFWDKVLQVFSNPSKDVKMTYIHKNDELIEDTRYIKIIQNKLTEDTRYIKIVQNELLEDKRGSIPVTTQNIKDVSSFNENERVFVLYNNTKRFVLFNNF